MFDAQQFDTHQKVIDGFKAVMANHGITTKEAIYPDGKLHRFHVEGDRRSTLNGAYVLYADGKPAGWFQHFSKGIKGTWSESGKREPLSKEMRLQIEADRKQRQLEQQQRHEQAAIKAREIWASSLPAVNHDYLSKKRVKPHNARLYHDSLVIPIYAPNKELVNLQFIEAQGNKRFLSGGKKKACFSIIGKPQKNEPILIGEGFATMASLYEDTGHFCIIALDAGNLQPVAVEIRKLYPISQIVICGDNDVSGVGQIKAQSAAALCGGSVLIPEIEGMDFNDVLTGVL
jgi:putative DNA primase/helicase